MPSVYLSPSNQYWNAGVGNYGTEMKRMNEIADCLAPLLQANGLTVYRNRPEMTLQQVIANSNAKKPDIHVAIHSNAASSPDAQGTEIWVLKKGYRAEKLANAIYKYLAPLSPGQDRGIKESDYYGEVRDTVAPAVIIEVGFHTNPTDAKWIMEQPQQIAEAIAKGILEYFGIPYQKPTPPPQQETGTPILGSPRATVGQAQAWAKKRGATEEFVNLTNLYWSIASPVRPEVAYAQAAKETAFGRFGGAVTSDMHNPCGLKVTNPKGDAREDHARFPDWLTGVKAHRDHLALYAGAPGYPAPNTPDPRHFVSIKGVAMTVEALGGRWAPSQDYGRSIVRDYLSDLLATEEDDSAPKPGDGVSDATPALPPSAFPEAQKWVVDRGISDGSNPTAPATREQVWEMLYRLAGKKG